MRTWSSSSRRSVPAKRSAKAFHVRRANRRAHEAHPRRPEYASEASAELRVVVADDNLWRVIHGGVPGLLRAPPRAMPPERVESCVMPAKNGRGLDEQDCVTPSWKRCQGVHRTRPVLPLCDDKLLTKKRVLRDQVYAVANEIRDHPGNEPKKVDHV